MASNRTCPQRKSLLIAHAILTICGLISLFVFLFGRDFIIMDYGIRQARRVQTILLVLVVILGISLFVHIILRMTRAKAIQRRMAQENVLRQEAVIRSREELARQKAKLSVDDKLSKEYLRDQLVRHYQGSWGTHQNTHLKPKLVDICHQLDEMDLYQLKLDHLLTNNGMDTLNDARDTLEQVEQYLLRNARKLVNCMDVYDPTSSDEVERLDTNLDIILSDNAKQLKNVKEFLFAMTDYINRQGEDDSDIQKLNIYKTAIINSMKEG